MADVAEARGLVVVCQQNQRLDVQVAGAWIDTQANDEPSKSAEDTDLSYWSGLGESYEPEWFPLGIKLPSAA